MNMFVQFFDKFFAKPTVNAQSIEHDLIQYESAIGRQLFGPIPAGTRREFFRLDTKTWVWHEQNKHGARVTRYMVEPTSIVKSVNGGQPEQLSKLEAERFIKTIEIYVHRVNTELYGSYAL